VISTRRHLGIWGNFPIILCCSYTFRVQRLEVPIWNIELGRDQEVACRAQVPVDQTRIERVECFRFFPSHYGSRLTIMWKFPHAASV
jgi:hypothetical protein